MIEIKTGNIFTTECQTIVNTVNCVGVMGAGIAYEFKLRFPSMFKKYKTFCDAKQFNIGSLWLYPIKDAPQSSFTQVLNFPTKLHWKAPTKTEYLELGLQKFVSSYQKKGITSIAFPLLGAANGGLSEQLSLEIMQHYLKECDIKIEIWHFDPTAKDDLYDQFKCVFLSSEVVTIEQKTGLRVSAINKIIDALHTPSINSISGLLKVKGVGKVTLEKAFLALNKNCFQQDSLF